MFLLDERELGGAAIDGDRPAAILEARRRRALDRADLPELLGRRASRGRAHPEAAAGAQALVEIDRPQILERVRDHVAVDAGAEADARGLQGAHVGQAVPEVALGGRAEADERARSAEEAR